MSVGAPGVLLCCSTVGSQASGVEGLDMTEGGNQHGKQASAFIGAVAQRKTILVTMNLQVCAAAHRYMQLTRCGSNVLQHSRMMGALR